MWSSRAHLLVFGCGTNRSLLESLLQPWSARKTTGHGWVLLHITRDHPLCKLLLMAWLVGRAAEKAWRRLPYFAWKGYAHRRRNLYVHSLAASCTTGCDMRAKAPSADGALLTSCSGEHGFWNSHTRVGSSCHIVCHNGFPICVCFDVHA